MSSFSGIELDQLQQIRFEERSLLAWWLRFESFCAQFLYRTLRSDAKARLLRGTQLQQNEN